LWSGAAAGSVENKSDWGSTTGVMDLGTKPDHAVVDGWIEKKILNGLCSRRRRRMGNAERDWAPSGGAGRS
jgi:hypothetical protein